MEWNIKAGIYLCFVLIYRTISMKKINPIGLVVLRWPPNIIKPLHWLILVWWFICVGDRNEMADCLRPISTSTHEAGNYRSCQTPKRSGHLPKVNLQEETNIYHAVQEDLKKLQAGWQTGGGEWHQQKQPACYWRRAGRLTYGGRVRGLRGWRRGRRRRGRRFKRERRKTWLETSQWKQNREESVQQAKCEENHIQGERRVAKLLNIVWMDWGINIRPSPNLLL